MESTTVNTHAVGRAAGARTGSWHVSLPLLAGLLTFLYGVSRGTALLADGDTYWHVAAGRWILEHGAVPTQDPFSHTRLGAPWTAHEWLSEVLLELAHAAGGWELVAALTALAFALSISILGRALLRSLEPIHVVAAMTLAVLMTAGHLVARPHILAMPLLVAWAAELVRARDRDAAPPFWLLPLMTLWANMHGGFTLGIGLAVAFAAEAVLAAARHGRVAAAARTWGLFVALAVVASLLTPHGPQGLLFTWQIMFEDSFMLGRIGEWRSPDFHRFQPLEVWLLGIMALAMHQGVKLPLARLVLLLGFTHLALKHVRNVELLGLLAPLFLAAPLAQHFHARGAGRKQFAGGDRLLGALTRGAAPGGLLLVLLLGGLATTSIWSATGPLVPPEQIAPQRAAKAARDAGAAGPVLNDYGWGGYLIYAGVPPFIDGRADMYRDGFVKEYAEAMDLATPTSLPRLLDRYQIGWTLLPPNRPATAMLDRLPGWRRVHADEHAVVHVKTSGAPGDAIAAAPARALP
ncbi:hypothetical protein RAMLITH_09465 [Ramlibacter sp. RBP-2]|uniref:Glycosyltransferase RgtA/B/C/D-like domain-containing protein n=1 Tax=Ramlibacter lithotrophicus TaxID=2606681 RepID=A0A7X6DF62_9BURK|nr:hypothetical protein [Ramlibacter lithotrophicus]NKE66047.1 hypothetical protein [Ramlibacter lithotrophicus]